MTELLPAETLAAARVVIARVSAQQPALAAKMARDCDMAARAPADRQVGILSAILTRYPALQALLPTGYPLILLRAEMSRICAYPGVPQAVIARLVLGESPAQISGGLTAREAHLWLTRLPYCTPYNFLITERGIYTTVRSMPVARWLVARHANPAQRKALMLEREERGPHGETIRGSFFTRTDELLPRDLRSSVVDTFRACAQRVLAGVAAGMAKQHRPLYTSPSWWRPARCARLLRTPAELVAEGRQMSHCVAVHAQYTRTDQTVIVALDVCGNRSTAEISRDMIVPLQHVGPGNNPPHGLCVRALEVLLARWICVQTTRQQA